MTLALQLSGLDPRYELYVILESLNEPNISVKDSDVTYEKLFNVARLIPIEVGGGFDFMHKAALKMNDPEKRKRLLGQYLLFIGGRASRKTSVSHLKFSHDDIDKAIDYLVAKLNSEFPKEPT